MKLNIIAAAAGLALAGQVSAQEPVWDGNTVVLEAQKLAEGIFAVVPTGAAGMATQGYPIATTGGFVIGSEGVLVVESMLNERLNRQLFDLIAAETDLPVKFLVNTSAHGDHSYGNFYVPDTVEIIQHANSAAYIAAYFEADTAFMIQNFGEGRGIEEVEPVAADILVSTGGQISVDLGGVTVDIKDFGFAQTGGDLFVSVPGADVLWTGNAVVAQQPALPWLLDGHLIETRDTLQAVYEAFGSETQVVPGHGPVTDIAAIKWNVDYLNAVKTEVEAAIADGLDMDATIAKVQLPEFQGYALFGWVHPGLNVPAAFNDLK